MKNCAIALIAACGCVGGVAGAAVPIQLRLFGDSSPVASGLEHVYVLAYFKESGPFPQHLALGAWSIADATMGEVNNLEIFTSIARDDSIGQFNDPLERAAYTIIGVNAAGGVSLTILDSAFTPGVSTWEDLFAASESTVLSWLHDGNSSELASWFNNEVVIPGYAADMGVRASQVDFSTASANGTGYVAMEIIPSPGSIAIAGVLGLLGTVRRRR